MYVRPDSKEHVTPLLQIQAHVPFVSPAGAKAEDWLRRGLGPVLPTLPLFLAPWLHVTSVASCQHLAVLTLLPDLQCDKCPVLHNISLNAYCSTSHLSFTLLFDLIRTWKLFGSFLTS